MNLKLHIPRFINLKLILIVLALCFILFVVQLFRTTNYFTYGTLMSIIESETTLDSRYKNKWQNGRIIFKESRRAHRLLDGKIGLEIGAATHNPYGLSTINVDYTEEITPFNLAEPEIPKAKVQIVAAGDNLPFTNDSVDFVISSHVIEHFWDPIKTIKEWLRVVKQNGYVYMDIPHKERTGDNGRNRTTLSELLERHNASKSDDGDPREHHNVWVPEDVLELAEHFNWDVVEWCDYDGKTAPNGVLSVGFTVVLQKSDRGWHKEDKKC